MKKNMMSHISSSYLPVLKIKLKALNYYVVEIPGRKIQTKKQYLDFLGEKFDMPDYDGWDAVADWLTDLDWIPNKRICIIIDNFKCFMQEEPEEKRRMMMYLKEDILTFWDTEVVKIVVGGQTRVFEVYLVD